MKSNFKPSEASREAAYDRAVEASQARADRELTDDEWADGPVLCARRMTECGWTWVRAERPTPPEVARVDRATPKPAILQARHLGRHRRDRPDRAVRRLWRDGRRQAPTVELCARPSRARCAWGGGARIAGELESKAVSSQLSAINLRRKIA